MNSPETQNAKQRRVLEIIEILRKALASYQKPAGQLIVEKYGKDPYLLLISCMLSLRAKDSASYPASCALFEYARTPEELLRLSDAFIEKLIYSVGFYRAKTKQIKKVSHALLERFQGCVPDTLEELLSLPGVGRKTANLVLGLAFDVPALCVDIHVHRISNRLGLVKTKTPEQTELELQKIVLKKHWVELNMLFVQLGQNICVPISPKCSQCPLRMLCPQIGVTRHR